MVAIQQTARVLFAVYGHYNLLLAIAMPMWLHGVKIFLSNCFVVGIYRFQVVFSLEKQQGEGYMRARYSVTGTTYRTKQRFERTVAAYFSPCHHG
jgi:hypothetical protein